MDTMNNKQIKDNSTLYIIFGAMQFMFCSTITGVITIVLAVLAKQDFDKNNINAYNEKIKAAKIVTAIAIALGIIAVIAIAVIMIITFSIMMETGI